MKRYSGLMLRPGAFLAADEGRGPFVADDGRDPGLGLAVPDLAALPDPGRSPATDPGLLPDGDACFAVGLDPALLAAEPGREPLEKEVPNNNNREMNSNKNMLVQYEKKN